MIRLALFCSLIAAPVFAEELADIDKPAPAFRLPVYNAASFGEATVSIGSLVGPDRKDKDTRVLLVSFMASFCGPCKKEMPYLQTLFEARKGDGLQVLMIAIDSEADGQKKIDELIALNKVTFPVGKDRFNVVARRWLGSKSPLPSLFVVRPDGTISAVHRGYSEDGAALLSKEVDAALGLKK